MERISSLQYEEIHYNESLFRKVVQLDPNFGNQVFGKIWF